MAQKIDLLRMVESGGCSSKIPPRQLEDFLRFLPIPDDPNILVDITTHDDAGVYRVNDDLALVFTTDFFPPVCSDPYEFGQIAAANSISDVYAMGGTPVIALNIMMFPSSELPLNAYGEILKGGADIADRAGVKIIGGHTIDDFPPKYGLAVVGYVHPDKIISNSGARPGDLLILTKPLGTGVILAGQRLGMATEKDVTEVKKFMKELNRNGAEVMKKFSLKGATDITGYGLGGHALKMAKAGKVSIELNLRQLPMIGNTYRLVDEGCIPAASFRNLDFVESDSRFLKDLDYNLKMIAMDAQTSGGLLMCAGPEIADQVIAELHNAGLVYSTVIGRITQQREKYLYIG